MKKNYSAWVTETNVIKFLSKSAYADACRVVKLKRKRKNCTCYYRGVILYELDRYTSTYMKVDILV